MPEEEESQGEEAVLKVESKSGVSPPIDRSQE